MNIIFDLYPKRPADYGMDNRINIRAWEHRMRYRLANRRILNRVSAENYLILWQRIHERARRTTQE